MASSSGDAQGRMAQRYTSSAEPHVVRRRRSTKARATTGMRTARPSRPAASVCVPACGQRTMLPTPPRDRAPQKHAHSWLSPRVESVHIRAAAAPLLPSEQGLQGGTVSAQWLEDSAAAAFYHASWASHKLYLAGGGWPGSERATYGAELSAQRLSPARCEPGEPFASPRPPSSPVFLTADARGGATKEVDRSRVNRKRPSSGQRGSIGDTLRLARVEGPQAEAQMALAQMSQEAADKTARGKSRTICQRCTSLALKRSACRAGGPKVHIYIPRVSAT